MKSKKKNNGKELIPDFKIYLIERLKSLDFKAFLLIFLELLLL